MKGVLYLVGLGLIAYPWWRYLNEVRHKKMLSDEVEKKKHKQMAIILSIVGVVVIIVSSVL